MLPILPLQSRDGRELFFVTSRGVSAVAIDAGPSFQWSSPKPLFDAAYAGFQDLAGGRNYDLSPEPSGFW